MSLLKRRWQFFTADEGLTADISKEFNISLATSQVLINRDLKTKDDIQEFLNPRISALKDPFEIPNMKKAVARVMLAKENNEKTVVYGDYDVDGVTGTSIIVLALRKIGMDPSFYIPHRYDEGYGMNENAVKRFADEGIKLIITVDCGVSNIKEISLANSLGMDVVVTDHHNIPEKLPDAVAIVNPKLIEGSHSSKDLAGAGVAFKFVWALFRTLGITDSASIKEYLDLAALGTVADVVPLVGENRTIAVSGIRVINEKKRVGVRHLADVAGINGKVSTHNISFMLAPRLNAPGRLNHAGMAMELLLENDHGKAQSLAAEINKVNQERQQIGRLIGEEAFAKMENVELKKLILLSGKNWHPGVIGIVASKVAERFNRPAVLISEEKDFCRGSARSIEGFDVFSLLYKCKDLFSDFGGHKDAAGFEMPKENLKLLEQRLCSEIDGCLAIDHLVPKTKIDLELDSQRITMDLAGELEKLEPFGSGNPAPVFMSKDLTVVNGKKVGNDGNHLKMKLSNGKSVFDSIGFGLGSLFDSIQLSKKIDVAYNLSVNEWDGFSFPQMELVDMRRTAQ